MSYSEKHIKRITKNIEIHRFQAGKKKNKTHTDTHEKQPQKLNIYQRKTGISMAKKFMLVHSA